MQKGVKFTHFNQKNTHINGCKIVYIYKNATITVHICTVIVVLQIIFYYFFSLSFTSLSLFLSGASTLTSLSFYLWSLILTSLISEASSPPPIAAEASSSAEASSLADQFWDFLFDQWVLGF